MSQPPRAPPTPRTPEQHRIRTLELMLADDQLTGGLAPATLAGLRRSLDELRAQDAAQHSAADAEAMESSSDGSEAEVAELADAMNALSVSHGGKAVRLLSRAKQAQFVREHRADMIRLSRMISGNRNAIEDAERALRYVHARQAGPAGAAIADDGDAASSRAHETRGGADGAGADDQTNSGSDSGHDASERPRSRRSSNSASASDDDGASATTAATQRLLSMLGASASHAPR